MTAEVLTLEDGTLTAAGIREAARRVRSFHIGQRVVVVRAIGDYPVGLVVVVHGKSERSVSVKPPGVRGAPALINVLHFMPLGGES